MRRSVDFSTLGTAGYDLEAVRALEAAALARTSEGELMQRAARAVASTVVSRARAEKVRRIVVLCGPGNNGADAAYAAAFAAEDLAGRARVVVIDAAKLGHGPRQALRGADAHVIRLAADRDEALRVLGDAELVIDGLLGLGARGGLSGDLQACAAGLSARSWVVSVDLPSGTDPDGKVGLPEGPGECVWADETVVIGVAKGGLLSPLTAPAYGRAVLADIGMGPQGDDVPEPTWRRLGARDLAKAWPVPTARDHKYTRGVVGVVAGSQQYPGAAVLACQAALEAGAGMVEYVGPEGPAWLVLQSLPEVVVGSGRATAWVVGPGWVPEADTHQRETACAAWASDAPMVVDAGALALIGGEFAVPRSAPTLLTPHAGEAATVLARLSGDAVTVDEVLADPLGSVQALAQLSGCHVLLKGATTLIAAPNSDVVWSQSDGCPWLATAGAGDVLAGLAGMLLAAGCALPAAGAAAAAVHGRAANAASGGGPIRAHRVCAALPGTVADLLSR